MIRQALRGFSFEQVGIGFTVTIIACLYGLAASDMLRAENVVAEALPINLEMAVAEPAPPPVVHVATSATAPIAQAIMTSELIAGVFASIGYKLDLVRTHGEVPRVFMANLPHDLSDIAVPAKRKVMFIKTALPLILHVNELIAVDRERIIALRDASAVGIGLAADDEDWLKRKAAEYGLDKVDFAELVRRVDAVPPSLALSQSAEESGWGTSRFAREGNALFGQRTWGNGNGIVPQKRGEGEHFRVAAFEHLIDGVKSYVSNLNTHPAYEDFRRLRAAQRRDHGAINGYALAETLIRYSERGGAYVRSLRAIIRGNALDMFDRAKLGERLATAPTDAPDA